MRFFKRIKTKLASIDTVLNFFYNILANHYIIFMQYEIRLFLIDSTCVLFNIMTHNKASRGKFVIRYAFNYFTMGLSLCILLTPV